MWRNGNMPMAFNCLLTHLIWIDGGDNSDDGGDCDGTMSGIITHAKMIIITAQPLTMPTVPFSPTRNKCKKTEKKMEIHFPSNSFLLKAEEQSRMSECLILIKFIMSFSCFRCTCQLSVVIPHSRLFNCRWPASSSGVSSTWNDLVRRERQ